MLHKNITTGDVHYLQNWSVADNTARDALSVAATDVGKVCQVTGTSTYYILTDDSPMTWQLIGSSGSVNSFSTIAVSGQSDVVADSSTDTLTLTAGSNITITTNAGTDTITIASSGGGGSGLTLGTPVTLTTQTSVDFTGIPAGTKRVSVNFSGVSTNGSSNIRIQLGDSGGIETTGYLGASTYVTGGSVFSSNDTSGFHLITSGASDVRHGSIILSLVDSSTFTWSTTGIIGKSDTSVTVQTAGSKSLSAELTQVRITTANGTDQFDAGTINISYE